MTLQSQSLKSLEDLMHLMTVNLVKTSVGDHDYV